MQAKDEKRRHKAYSITQVRSLFARYTADIPKVAIFLVEDPNQKLDHDEEQGVAVEVAERRGAENGVKGHRGNLILLLGGFLAFLRF